MPSDERIQRQRERGQHLIALRESSSYPILKQIVEAKVAKESRKFISTASVSNQELDWGRGFMFGMQTVLEIIENGEKVLEQAIRAAQALEGAEEA